MATTLTINGIKASIAWDFQNSLTGSINTGNTNSFSYAVTLANGTGAAGTADLLYAAQGTIAASGAANFDLAGSLTDFFGNTITMARLKVIYVENNNATTASSIAFGNHAAPVINWISAATSTVKIYNGGILLLATTDATAYAVTATTADGLKILNNDGANTCTYKVVFIGSTA